MHAISITDIIGVGLGAYLMCKDWRAGKESGNKASLHVDGRIDGSAAVKVLAESIRSGNPLPETTLGEAVMVDPTTWEAAGVKCT
jgi:L-arabinose transport system substrate-binding protein